MTIYAAEPNSPTAHALTLLASWAAISHDTGAPADKDRGRPATNLRSNR
jgi:hypothetical protein